MLSVTFLVIIIQMMRPYEPEPNQSEMGQKIPNELLDDIEVSTMLENIDGSVDLLNTTPSDERIKQFVDPDNFLGNFYKERELAPEISEQEDKKLEKINHHLNSNKEVVNQIIDTLIESQKVNLINRGVPKDTVDVEIKHITEVVALTKRIFPNMPILHLAAAVHDSYKYNSKGQMELALHELTSTALGPLLVEKMLLKHKSEILFGNDETEKREINHDEIQLILKLIKRALETHGTDEFPDQTAAFTDNDNPNIGILYDSVKPRPSKNSWSLLDQKASSASITIAGLNYLDAITGTNRTSFIKYNNPITYQNSIFIQEIQTPADYVTKKLFSSFESNIGMVSGEKLSQLENIPDIQNIDELKQIVRENRVVKETIEYVLSKNHTPLIESFGYGSTIHMLRLASYLEGSFNKLRNTVIEKKNDAVNIFYLNERKKFDVELNLFIQTVYSIVSDRINKSA